MLYYNPDRHFYTFKLIYSPANELLVVVQNERKNVGNKVQKQLQVVKSFNFVVVTSGGGEIVESLTKTRMGIAASSPIILTKNPSTELETEEFLGVTVYNESAEMVDETCKYCDKYYFPLITSGDAYDKINSRNYPIIKITAMGLVAMARVAGMNKVLGGMGLRMEIESKQGLTPDIRNYTPRECVRGMFILNEIIMKQRAGSNMRRGHYNFDDLISLVPRL